MIRMIVKVDGMACSMCEAHVTRRYGKQFRSKR